MSFLGPGSEEGPIWPPWRGKSGGYRVITFYSGSGIPLFLLNVFAKGDRVNLSQAERNELRRELTGLVEDYQKGIWVYVNRRKPHSP